MPGKTRTRKHSHASHHKTKSPVKRRSKSSKKKTKRLAPVNMAKLDGTQFICIKCSGRPQKGKRMKVVAGKNVRVVKNRNRKMLKAVCSKCGGKLARFM